MSAADQLPDVARAFVLRHIDSVAELEGLLLIRSSEAQAWNSSLLASRLYIRDAEAKMVLHALHRRGLLSLDGETFAYAPASDALRDDVEALATAYPRFLIPITKIVHAKPHHSLRDFADAFRLREEK